MVLSGGYSTHVSYDLSVIKILEKKKPLKQSLGLTILTGCCLFLAKGLLFNWSMSSNNQSETTAVPYTIATGYFVKNTFPANQLQCIIIKNQEDLDSILGMAATMGATGRPTEINFGRQYAIACIYPATDRDITLRPISLFSSGKEVRLQIQLKSGAQQSYTIVPLLLLAVKGKPPLNFKWEQLILP
jgi:hypothetical protein